MILDQTSKQKNISYLWMGNRVLALYLSPGSDQEQHESNITRAKQERSSLICFDTSDHFRLGSIESSSARLMSYRHHYIIEGCFTDLLPLRSRYDMRRGMCGAGTSQH